MKPIFLCLTLLLAGCKLTGSAETDAKPLVSPGPRPLYLLQALPDDDLKQRLQACKTQPFYRHDFSIGHRGAPLMFAEHSKQSYQAAIDMGAGIVECDVAFTADKQLVCRHAQCDLHQTTDILLRPELAAKCAEPFSPAEPANGKAASARCCTSDISVAEFSGLCAKMDGVNPHAQNVADYVQGTPGWRTDLYSQCATPMTHQDSVALFKQQGVKMTPELKQPQVPMPYSGGYRQQDYAQQLVDEYKAAGVAPSQVYLQSFNWQDILYWLEHEPEFGRQAVWLDGRYEQPDFNPMQSRSWQPSMAELKASGLNIIAPPLWLLVTEQDGKIVPSAYAKAAKAAGLEIIAWSLERSAPLAQGKDWYYQSLPTLAKHDGVVLQLLDVLARDVGVTAVFSDWPGTTTFYANCLLGDGSF
ncbi:glycerophosphodiester phosphodiesterase [Rheinheimera sp. YQF-2]|uniref:glycerophosphodiester phosphodiesterase n=1 Tax=Rheinheimera lutimaris TaxID=2740584 RepID=A0A7Y5ATM7_9GAMM|nr:glycerophosphodiester phosphodiesterase family protein [Rheinheimera lutimaris]NRQ43824.1 glycerophosphodiester phosphodiesterase [Rheinheimera lutimaris]